MILFLEFRAKNELTHYYIQPYAVSEYIFIYECVSLSENRSYFFFFHFFLDEEARSWKTVGKADYTSHSFVFIKLTMSTDRPTSSIYKFHIYTYFSVWFLDFSSFFFFVSFFVALIFFYFLFLVCFRLKYRMMLVFSLWIFNFFLKKYCL